MEIAQISPSVIDSMAQTDYPGYYPYGPGP